ncbi:IS3 familytransposase orf1 [Streptococcus thermophilus]|nr:IS3 familytransposase orf1 [Streptococcus thermophilus]
MDSEKTKIFTRNYKGSFIMSKRSPKSISEKLEIVLLHLEAGKSLSWLARRYGVSKDTLSNWVRKYKEAGVEGTRGKSSLDEV